MAAAFLALSAGLLTHYSAEPVCRVCRAALRRPCLFRMRANKWRELAVIATICLLLLATWFGWSIATYGKHHATFASNTTITSSEAYAGSTLGKIAANIGHSIAPAVLRDPSSPHFFDQVSRAGFLSDNVFIFYESNIVFSMGVTGGGLVLWLLYRAFRRAGRHSTERSFWMAMIPFCIVLGIAVVGEADQFGVAHVTLLSLAVLGLTMLAGRLPLRRVAMAILIAGCAMDFSLGILLHVRVQSLESGSATAGPESLSPYARGNWFQKHQYELKQQTDPAAAISEDDASWQGWYGRHGGSITFLGDHFERFSFDGNGLLQVLLVIQLACLLWALRTRQLLFRISKSR